MPMGTYPPDFFIASERYIKRRQLTIFRRMPFFDKIRKPNAKKVFDRNCFFTAIPRSQRRRNFKSHQQQAKNIPLSPEKQAGLSRRGTYRHQTTHHCALSHSLRTNHVGRSLCPTQNKTMTRRRTPPTNTQQKKHFAASARYRPDISQNCLCSD